MVLEYKKEVILNPNVGSGGVTRFAISSSCIGACPCHWFGSASIV